MELASGNLHHWMEMYRTKTSPSDMVGLMNDILQGIAYLHRNNYVHRRLNPDNILMVETGNQTDHFKAKIGDFQDITVFFQSEGDKPLPVAGDQSVYTAPEVLMGYEHYLPAADMWSFGIMLFEMVFGKDITPFYDQQRDTGWFSPPQKSRVVDNIFNWLGTPDREWRETYTHNEAADREAVPGRSIKQVILAEAKSRNHGFKDKTFHMILDLIDACLRINPEERISALHALRHPLFQKFRLGIVRGEELKMPKVPNTPRGTFTEIRRDIIRTAARDIEGGYMHYYPSLMALNLFDRSHTFFTQDIYEDSDDGSINTDLVYGLYCTCYLMAVKLMIELPTPTPDLFEHVKGIVCGNTEKNRLTMLFMERTIASQLKFKFFVNEIADLPLNMGIFRKLEHQPMRPHKLR
jgi:serine/threonine protein kinase